MVSHLNLVARGLSSSAVLDETLIVTKACAEKIKSLKTAVGKDDEVASASGCRWMLGFPVRVQYGGPE